MPGFKLSSTWTKALAACPDPARARHYLGLFAAACPDGRLPELNAGQIQVVATLFGASQALSNALVSRPDWLETLDPEGLKFPRRKQGLQREVAGWLPNLVAERSFGPALARVREFKQREMLGIAARDLGRFGGATEITWELSDLADVVLGAVWQLCHSQLVERWGRPYHQDADGRWHPTAGCVLGLGKLGGQELNYSSDVDVLFAYTEEGSVFKTPPSGSTAPREILSSHQFFNRVAESFVAEVGRLAPEGMLYRIDLRLRPEGDSGPLSRSLEGYENYYAQWGQTWERMMLIKARGVAGDGSLAAEFLEMVQPFRYPRSVGGGVLREVAAMKDRIENEVVREGELERNVKLGRGGIREIEFIAQAFQVLHGGRQPFLQGAQTLPTLQKLVQYELLSAADAQTLEKAYTFLRDVEHRLQMEDNQQTHTIPTNLPAQERLARTMGFAKLKKFQAAHQENSQAVRQIFERLLKTEKAAPTAGPAFPTQFEGARPAWDQFLAGLNFRDIEKAFQVLREFVEGPGYVHVSPRTSELARQLLPRLFARCVPDGAAGSPGRLSDPDRVVTRLDAFISAYGARATLFELWNRNPSIFELLLQLFDRSEFLAELAIRTPDLERRASSKVSRPWRCCSSATSSWRSRRR